MLFILLFGPASRHSSFLTRDQSLVLCSGRMVLTTGVLGKFPDPELLEDRDIPILVP